MFGYQLKNAVTLFGIMLLANLLIAAALLSTGVEGEFLADSAWNTFLGFFGGFGSLIAILVTLAIIAGAYLGTVHLSRIGHHQLVGVIVLIALVVGGYILWRWVDWNAMAVQFSWSIIWLIVFTIIEAIVGLAALSSSTVRRQRPVVAPAK